jgi:glycosyltransferase involved in cell wall biosynthesis
MPDLAGAPKFRVLVVSYAFPPTGGAAVARVSKLVKYLPAHGAEAAVLTVSNPSVPLRDSSRDADTASARLYRARTLEPPYWTKSAVWSASGRRPGLARRLAGPIAAGVRTLLVPDPQVLWLPASRAELVRATREFRPDVVVISAPPFSQFLLAPLAQRLGAAVVLDYRDEWTTAATAFEMAGTLAGWAGGKLEKRVVTAADGIVVATAPMRGELLRRFPALDPAAVRVITNGFDPDDFPSARPEPPGDRFVITYAGTVFKLTSARPFLSALKLVWERAPDLARILQVNFIGRIVSTEQDAFAGTESLGVRVVGFLSHRDTQKAILASHMTLCLVADVPGGGRILTQKIFELAYAGREVLALAPPGALQAFVQELAIGQAFHPDDSAAIATHLERRLREFQSGTLAVPTTPDLMCYRRDVLAGEFLDFCRQVRGRSAAGQRP